MNVVVAALSIGVACSFILTVERDTALAQEQEVDQLFRKNCVKCHGPKPDRFARAKLMLKNGNLVGSRSGRPVEDVLKKHFGVRISPEQTSDLIKALRQHL